MRDLVKFTDIVQSIKNIYKLYKAIKELYPKMIIFMGYKTEEAFIKKYQGKAAKNAIFDFSGSCDSFHVRRINYEIKNCKLLKISLFLR